MVTAIHQPPYVIKKLSTDGVGNVNIAWDGVEIRLLRIIGQRLNFSYEVLEPKIGNPLGSVSNCILLKCVQNPININNKNFYYNLMRIRPDIDINIDQRMALSIW